MKIYVTFKFQEETQTALMNKQSEFTSPKAGLILTIIAIC